MTNKINQKLKFPKLFQHSRTGELSATDNARINGIQDTHTAIRDLIDSQYGGNSPYKSLLSQQSSLIHAAEMVNENASNLSKIDSWTDMLGKHPYLKLMTGWEALKHTIAPGLPGL